SFSLPVPGSIRMTRRLMLACSARTVVARNVSTNKPASKPADPEYRKIPPLTRNQIQIGKVLVAIRADGGANRCQSQKIVAAPVHLQPQFSLRLIFGLEVHRQRRFQQDILVQLRWRWVAGLGDLHGIKMDKDVF